MFRNARAMGGVPIAWVFILFFWFIVWPDLHMYEGWSGQKRRRVQRHSFIAKEPGYLPRLQPVWSNVLPKLATPNFVLLRLGLIRLSVPLHPTLLVV